jgi:hypothetical protein
MDCLARLPIAYSVHVSREGTTLPVEGWAECQLWVLATGNAVDYEVHKTAAARPLTARAWYSTGRRIISEASLSH